MAGAIPPFIQGIDTVGYTREVLFPIRIRVRDPAVETKVELKLAIYACSTICVREDLVLSGRSSQTSTVPLRRRSTAGGRESRRRRRTCSPFSRWSDRQPAMHLCG